MEPNSVAQPPSAAHAYRPNTGIQPCEPSAGSSAMEVHADSPRGIQDRRIALASFDTPAGQSPIEGPSPTESVEDQDPSVERLPQPKSKLDQDHPSDVGTGEPLPLSRVIESVGEHFPLLEVAYFELMELEGKHLAAYGKFDTKLLAETFSAPLGFYKNYRNSIKFGQPLQMGGEFYGGYRIGDGDIPPWYGERETNEGGEFKLGVLVPTWRDRNIDKRRANLWARRIDRERLEPEIDARIIDLMRAAADAYWNWVAAGHAVRTQEFLLLLARRRVGQIDARIREGDLPRIASLDNGRFVAKREEKLVEAQRKLQAAAFKLSLFLRDENGNPWLPDERQIPRQLPKIVPISDEQAESDVQYALSVRPEFVDLNRQIERAQVDLAYARNLTLPRLDVGLEAGQDIGGAASDKRDKGPFELEAGALASIPLQRREGGGKIRAAESKIRQLRAKQRFLRDKISIQVRDSISAVNRAAERIDRAQVNLRLVRQSLELGRLSFDAGDIDLIQLNIYETDAADAELLLIQAELDYFLAMTEYRASRAEDQGIGYMEGLGRDILSTSDTSARPTPRKNSP